MTTAERLAAYLSGDLSPDEQQALEAELAGDAALRARLDQIAEADAALAELEVPEPTPEFSARLRDAVGSELDVLLGDELARRRARREAAGGGGSARRRPNWTVLGGAAAAALAVVVGVSALSGGDDGLEATSGDGEADRAATMAEPFDGAEDQAMEESLEADVLEDFAGGADAELAPPAPGAPASPILASLENTVTSEYLAALAADPTLLDTLGPEGTARLQRAADGTDPVAQDYAARYQGSTTTEAADDDAADDRPIPATDPNGLQLRGDADDADRQAVAACLPTVLDGEVGTVIPVYAEVAVDTDGIGVVLVAVLTTDGDRAQATVWMLDQATCQVLERVEGPELA